MLNTSNMIVALLSFRFRFLIKLCKMQCFFLPLKLDIVTSSEGATEIPSLVTRYLRLSDWVRNLFGAELK